MFRKKNPAPNIDAAIAKSVNYEVTIADLAQRSARRAWVAAFAAMLMSLILAGGYFYMLPLKEKVPFLVMADAYTGNATVARLSGNFSDHSITASEAINRSNVAHFVMMRESYDYAMVNLRDWRAVHSMSSPEVAVAYSGLYARNNPDSPYKLYGQSRSIRVKILSIVFIGGGNNIPPKGATVRFQRSVYEKINGATTPLDSKIATLEYSYNFSLKMDEQDRIENPLGFQVTSYRVDSDYAASPPVATQAEAAPSPIASEAQAAGVPTPTLPPSDAIGSAGSPADLTTPASSAAVTPVNANQPATPSSNDTNGASTR